jgi:hypothetical protein
MPGDDAMMNPALREIMIADIEKTFRQAGRVSERDEAIGLLKSLSFRWWYMVSFEDFNEALKYVAENR